MSAPYIMMPAQFGTPNQTPSFKRMKPKSLLKQLEQMKEDTKALEEFLKSTKKEEKKKDSVAINPLVLAMCFISIQPIIGIISAIFILSYLKEFIPVVVH